jgi:polyhydroxybutyrate depolymerase
MAAAAISIMAAAAISIMAFGSAGTYFLPSVHAAARPLERHLRVDGLDRRFLVYLPSGYQQNGALRVLLAFHGATQTPEGLADLAHIHDARLAADYVVVYPEGYKRYWNIAGICCGPAAKANINDVTFARAILDDLATFVRIDRQRVYATGYSNGGAESYHLGCAMSDAIAAIAPMSSNMWDPKPQCRPVHPMPVYTWHGLQDNFAPYYGGITAARGAPPAPSVQQNVEFWAQIAGTTQVKHVALFGGNADCDINDGGRNNTKVVSCRIAAMGHRWPGSRPTPTSRRGDAFFARFVRSLGPYGPSMEVNDAMLEFFNAYVLPADGS